MRISDVGQFYNIILQQNCSIWVERGHERARYTLLSDPSGTQWSESATWS